LVQCQGRTWTATAGSSANEVIFTPDTPIVLPPEQSASPTLNNCFISFQVKLESLEPSSGPNSDDTPEKVEVVAGFSTVLSDGHAGCGHRRRRVHDGGLHRAGRVRPEPQQQGLSARG